VGEEMRWSQGARFLSLCSMSRLARTESMRRIDGSRQIKRGEKQVKGYCDECDVVHGPGHTGTVQTYDPAPYVKRIDKEQP